MAMATRISAVYFIDLKRVKRMRKFLPEDFPALED
jgi:hypothetical protein